MSPCLLASAQAGTLSIDTCTTMYCTVQYCTVLHCTVMQLLSVLQLSDQLCVASHEALERSKR